MASYPGCIRDHYTYHCCRQISCSSFFKNGCQYKNTRGIYCHCFAANRRHCGVDDAGRIKPGPGCIYGRCGVGKQWIQAWVRSDLSPSKPCAGLFFIAVCASLITSLYRAGRVCLVAGLMIVKCVLFSWGRVQMKRQNLFFVALSQVGELALYFFFSRRKGLRKTRQLTWWLRCGVSMALLPCSCSSWAMVLPSKNSPVIKKKSLG